MPAIARLAAVSLDAPDPRQLADFYRNLLDLEVAFDSDDFVALKGAGVWLTTQRVEGHRPTTWPDDTVPKQLHLELAVTDLDVAERAAVELGATVADAQPSPDRWRVLLDPVGHPFCITTLIPAD
jgi:catechol 2,3-dioxygenase-like lactoylglutathione lyase family enzyme